jgi:hypothetical protein
MKRLYGGGQCPICERTVQTMHVDHNHTRGKVRGFLCPRCNVALGLFCDDPDLLHRAIKSGGLT